MEEKTRQQEIQDVCGEIPGHHWIGGYYGWKCDRCDLFYPYGCAPWEQESEVQR